MIPISDDSQRRRAPVVVVVLIVANVAAFVWLFLAGPADEDLIWSYGLVPYKLSHPLYYGWAIWGQAAGTLVTAAFLHGGLLHLAGNMLFLWVFGDNLEDSLGHGHFLAFYFLAALAGSLTHTVLMADSRIPTIGASGAVAGILGGYLLLFPKSKVRTLLFLGPFITIARVPAILLIGFWAILQLLNGLLVLNPIAAEAAGVAYWTHIGGFVAGLVTVRGFVIKRR
jgi:membrane associated rhomboid family serine protease